MKATEKQKIYMREYFKDNQLKIQERRRKYYQEHEGDRLARHLSYEEVKFNPSFLNANQSRATEWARKAKLKLLFHYSNGTNRGSRCGFDDMRALSIDHINGGGNKHRKKVKNFYSWLIRNDFPDGYQVLCMNCQFIKIKERGENRWQKII